MDLGRLEGVMPTKEQVPTEHYNVNDKIKSICNGCRKRTKREHHKY